MFSNYTVKRILPRLIVAALLVNVSYWICALAVDLSNVVGQSIYHIIGVELTGGITNDNLSDAWSRLGAFLLSAGAVGAVAAGVTVTVSSYTLLGALALLIPGAIAAFLAFVTILFILLARQAIVIMLVILSPLAFLAYLLPNTEEWFTRWRKLFVAMLLLYPTISLLFAGGKLAATIIRGVTSDPILYVASLIIVALPLFLVLTLLRASSNLVNKAAGFVNNPNRGPFDAMRKRGERYTQRQQNLRMGRQADKAADILTNGDKYKRYGEVGSRRRAARAWVAGIGSANKITRDEKDKYAEVTAKAGQRNYVAKRAYAGDDATEKENEQAQKYATKLAGGDAGTARLIQSYAVQETRNESKKDIDAMRSMIQDQNPDRQRGDFLGKMISASQGGDDGAALAAAYAAEIAARGSGEDFEHALNESRKIQNDKARKLVQQELIDNMREDHAGVSDTMRGLMKSGDLDDRYVQSRTRRDAQNGNFEDDIYLESLDERLSKKGSGESVVKMKKHDQTRTKYLADNGLMTNEALSQMLQNIVDARSNPNTSIQIKGELKDMFTSVERLAMSRGTPLPTPTPQGPPNAAQQTASAPFQTPPPLRGGEAQTGGGLIVPRDMR